MITGAFLRYPLQGPYNPPAHPPFQFVAVGNPRDGIKSMRFDGNGWLVVEYMNSQNPLRVAPEWVGAIYTSHDHDNEPAATA